MTDRPEEDSATESNRTSQAERETANRGTWGRWPVRTRVLWALCAVAYVIFLVEFYWFARTSTFTEWGSASPAHGPDKIIVSFRNDDLSVYSSPTLEDSVLSIFKAHGVRQTFAFIPNPAGYIGGSIEQPPGNPRMVELLRQWEQEGVIEFALHGLTHLKNNIGAGEFDRLPADIQFAMVRKGKATLDSTLGTNVRIFAPPWNQVDGHTMEACARAGIDKMSGYIGTPPAAGIMAVNSNALLFYAPGEIPPVDRVLELAKSGSGTRFVNVFYHSRVDFRDPEAFRRTDSLLTALRVDPEVEILTLGEIAARYAGLLKPCSESGWNIVEAETGLKSVKPYLDLFSRLPLLSDQVQNLQRRYQRALESFWCGDYMSAHVQAKNVVRMADNWLALGRLLAPLAAGTILGLFFIIGPKRKTVLVVYAIMIVLIVLVLLALAAMTKVSPERVREFARLATVFAGGLLLVLPWLPQMRPTSARHL